MEGVLVMLAPTLIVGAALQVPRVAAVALRMARRHRARRRPPAPVVPPVERLAADLRRLRATIARIALGDPPSKALRLRAARLAYDDLLVDACRALDIDHALASLSGESLELERLRVEEELARAGLDVGAPHG